MPTTALSINQSLECIPGSNLMVVQKKQGFDGLSPLLTTVDFCGFIVKATRLRLESTHSSQYSDAYGLDSTLQQM